MRRSVGFGLVLLGLMACEATHREFQRGRPLQPDGDAGELGGGGRGGEAAELSVGGLRVTPGSVGFGPVPIGFAAPARILLRNETDVALSGVEPMLLGAMPADFALAQNDCSATLMPGEACSLVLAFQPAVVGLSAAELQLSVRAGTYPSIPLAGEGVEAGTLIVEAAPGNGASFEDVLVNTNRVQVFRVSNPSAEGSGAIHLRTNDAAFSILTPQGTECADGTDLGAGASCDFRVAFRPVERGPAEATLAVLSGSGRANALNLSGRGVLPAVLEINTTQLDFGPVELLSAASLEISVTNAGDQELPPVTAALASDSASEFALAVNGCSRPLSPGGSCNVSVAFTPIAAGERVGAIELDAGASGSARVELIGNGVEPGALILGAADGSSTSFGGVVLGTALTQTFQLTNPGEEASGALQIAVNNEEFALAPPSGGDCVSGSTDLAGGASCTIRVSFQPFERQQRNATLTVTSAILGSRSLNLNGIGLAPARLTAVESTDFGRTSQGESTRRSILITNLGDEPMGAVSAMLSGQQAADFQIEQNACAVGLRLDESCELSVAFSPSTVGSRLATLQLAATPGGARDVRLEGFALLPGALALAPAPGSSADFTPGVVVGSGQTQTQTFVLTNTGGVASGPINLVPLAGGFQLLTPTGTDCRSNVTDLVAGATCTIRVQFTPPARGSSAATLSVNSQAAGSASLGLNGTGLAPASLGADATQLTFTNPVTVGQNAALTLTLRNQGDVSLNPPTAQLTGTQAGDFAIATNNCTAALGANASCTISIRFEPDASGARAATLRLQSAGGNLDIALSGIGQQPGSLALQAMPGSADFGTVAVNASRSQTFTLRNTGDLSAGRIISITLGTGFSRQTAAAGECNPGATVLEGGQSCTIRVLFQPGSAGAFDVNMNVTSQLAGSASLALSGFAQAPAVLQAATQISFPGSTEVNLQSAPINWVVTNAGGTATPPLTFSNSNTSEFVTTNGCTGVLPAGTACTVVIRFRPSAPGNRLGTLTVSAGQGISTSVATTGVGQCPPGTEDDGGVCRLINGQTCTSAAQCESDICSTFFRDADEDGFGDANGVTERRCGPIPLGFVANNEDCCDLDERANPDQVAFQSAANLCGTFDYNCDDDVTNSYEEFTPRFPASCVDFPVTECRGGFTAWTNGTFPPCGGTGTITACNVVAAFSPERCSNVNGVAGVVNRCL